jgi:hypothetical protein
MPRVNLIQLRGGTAAAWTSANPVLGLNEPGIETDTRKTKYGDGVTAWNSLAYTAAGGAGTVTSVTGTSNRISVDNTNPAVPVINIDAAYDTAITTQINAAIVGLFDDRGNFDASVNAYPSSGGSGTAGAILKGDIWRISVAGTLPTGLSVQVGDFVRALVDTPGNTQSNWAIAEGFVPDASETVKGVIEIATQAETNTGTDDVRAVTALKVKNRDAASSVLTDAASIDITSDKHTLTTALGRTFTISFTGDDIVIEVTLNATSAIQTFPAGALCISEGVPTGDNTCPMLGASGDKYIIAIKKIGSVYYVVCKNFEQ